MNEYGERLTKLGATKKRGSTVDMVFNWRPFYSYKAQPMSPRALKASRALTPLVTPELLLPLLSLALEVDFGVEEVVEVGPESEEDKVTPCDELDKVQRNDKQDIGSPQRGTSQLLRRRTE